MCLILTVCMPVIIYPLPRSVRRACLATSSLAAGTCSGDTWA